MKSSTASYKQSLQNQGGVNYMQINIFFFVVAPNLQVVVIIKKGENVNHEDFDDIKKNLLEKEGDVNHASFDGVEKKSYVCHHQKGGECECMYT